MTESKAYEVTCQDCGEKMTVHSPATLTCQKCGGGTFAFKQQMLFHCLHGHLHIGKVSVANCPECTNADRSLWRRFEPNKGVGDEDNRMPEVDEVHAEAPKPKTVKTKSGIKRRRKKK